MDEITRLTMRLEVLRMAGGNTKEAQSMWDWLVKANEPAVTLAGSSQMRPGDVAMVSGASAPFGCR